MNTLLPLPVVQCTHCLNFLSTVVLADSTADFVQTALAARHASSRVLERSLCKGPYQPQVVV